MPNREDLDRSRLQDRLQNKNISNFSSATLRRLALSRLGRTKG